MQGMASGLQHLGAGTSAIVSQSEGEELVVVDSPSPSYEDGFQRVTDPASETGFTPSLDSDRHARIDGQCLRDELPGDKLIKKFPRITERR